MILVLVIVIALGGGILFLANNKNSSDTVTPQENIKEVVFAGIQKDLESNDKLFDVRTPEEYSEKHFAGAENLPIQDIEAGKMPDIDKSTKIYLYCRSGVRAASAAKYLSEAGFVNVVNLGGLSDVENIGGEYVEN